MKQILLWHCKALLCLLQVCCLQQATAQHVGFAWTRGAGGSSNHDCGEGVAVDTAGNIYVAGWFVVSATFYPGTNTPIVSAGTWDALLIKYDRDGNILWAKNLGGAGEDNGYGIALDATGAVYVTGYFTGTADLNPGGSGGVLTGVGGRDVFLAKYDLDGNYIWAKSMGGAADEMGNSVAVDGSGNVSITGMFISAGADFDPGPGTALLTPLGFWDVFVAKYDSNGNYIWAKSVGGFYHDYCQGIAVDGTGSVYITGMFNSTVDFDPGPGTAILTASFEDAFLAKYDANGNYLWARRLGGSSVDRGYSVAVDGAGNAYVAGPAYSTDFDAGGGVLAANGPGVFLAKYDPNGNYLWAKCTGGDSYRLGVSVDATNNVYMTGGFRDTVDFNPGGPGGMFIAAGGIDAFLVKRDPTGNYLWAKDMGGSDAFALGASVSVGNTGNVYVTGQFGEGAAVDFDPGPDTATLSSTGWGDAFVLKLACTDTTSSYLKIAECGESYTLNDITYSTGGSYEQHFINAAGCDSTVRLDLALIRLDTISTLLGEDRLMFFCDHPASNLKLKANIPYNDVVYLWQDGSTANSYTVTEPGTYWVEVSKEGCTVSDTVRIEGVKILDFGFSDTVFCKSDPIDITLRTPQVPPGTVIQWSTGSSNSSIHITDQGLYWVNLINPPCILTDSIRINALVCECFANIPSAFSPNGDGLNDYFQPVIEAGCPVSGYVCSIYNRFGERVFSGLNATQGWDGRYKGEPADVGTYFYEVYFTGGARQQHFYFKGNITLIR